MGSGADAALTTARIATTSGSLKVIAEERTDIEATGNPRISFEGATATVDGGSSRLIVRIPEGMDVVAGSGSGRVEVIGRVGAAAITARSGRVDVEAASSVDVRTKSGRVVIGTVSGMCRVSAGSGRVTVERCGSAHVTSKSGRVAIGAADGPVSAHCVSGRIDIAMSSAADVDVDTVSGTVRVTLPAGTRPQVIGTSSSWPSMPPFDCVVSARSVSGRVRVSTP